VGWTFTAAQLGPLSQALYVYIIYELSSFMNMKNQRIPLFFTSIILFQGVMAAPKSLSDEEMGNALIEVNGLINDNLKTVETGSFLTENSKLPLQPNNIEPSRVYAVEIEFKPPPVNYCTGYCNLRPGMMLGPLQSITPE